MYCKKCGNKIDDDALFCSHCGTKVSSEPATKDEQKNDNQKKKSSREVVYDGDIHKCPNCGEILKSFVTTCPSCGHEIRGSKGGTNKVEVLAEKLQKTQNIAKKKELISNFYVPNTKEDIIEFFTLAVSQIDDDNGCSEAWCSKLDQTLIKAKLSFGSTEEYTYLLKLYENAKKERRKIDARKHRKITIRIIASVILAIVGTIFMVVGTVGANASGDPDSPLYMFIMIGMFAYLAIAWVWISLSMGNDSEKKKKSKSSKHSETKAASKVKVTEVEIDNTDSEDDEEDEEDEEEDEDDDEEDDEDDDEEDEKGSVKSAFKEVGESFKEIGRSFKDMFK